MEVEVQFFRDLIDQLRRDYAIGPERFFVNGLSNGAGMALRLACALPDRVAAIGGVAGGKAGRKERLGVVTVISLARWL